MDMNTALKNFLTDTLATLAESMTLTIRTGSSPGVEAAATGTTLVTFSSLSFDAAVDGTASLTATVGATATGAGGAGYGRLTDGTYVIDDSVTTSTAGGFVINTTSILNGSSVSLNTCDIDIG